MEKVFIDAHQGLGDHLICNGIYREYAKNYSECILPVKRSIFKTVNFMLSDVPNIKVVAILEKATGKLINSLRNLYAIRNYKILKLGYKGRNFTNDGTMRFDESFYTQAGVDFAKRWDSFYYPRDIKSEISLFEELNCKKMGYAFLHEDKSRKYLVNREKISKGLKVIEPGTHQSQRNFFDYGYILENAAELHCIESSFTALIESMQISNIKYAHRYSRPEAKGAYCFEFTYKTDWTIIH